MGAGGENSAHGPADAVVFRAYYFFPDGVRVPDSIRELNLRTRHSPGSGAVLTIVDRCIEQEDWSARQAEFDKVVAEFGEMVSRARVPTELQVLGVTFTIAIAFVPEEGHAGISITPQTLYNWSQLGADLMLEGWPGQIWVDGRNLPGRS